MKRSERDDEFEEDEDRGHAFGPSEESDQELEGEVEVECPYCGEVVAIAPDAGGGSTQEYVEDCPVCCQPWQVHLRYDAEGAVEIRLEQAS